MATSRTPNSQTSSSRARASQAGRKAAATRKRNAAQQAATTVAGDTQTAAETLGAATQAEAKVRVHQVRYLAQRTVDLPVGVGLVARDSLVSSVRGLATTLSHRDRIERELSRCERRGASARNRFETQVQRTRADFERQANARRARVGKLVGDAQRRIGSAL